MLFTELYNIAQHVFDEMGPGHSVAIVVGGAAESLEARPGNFTLTLKHRKGFVKLALRSGYVFVFNSGQKKCSYVKLVLG